MKTFTKEEKFKIELKALLEKYDADFSVEEISDYQGSYAKCIEVEISSIYDKEGKMVEPGVIFDLPKEFSASDIKFDDK
jgi:hypothetical protein